MVVELSHHQMHKDLKLEQAVYSLRITRDITAIMIKQSVSTLMSLINIPYIAPK